MRIFFVAALVLLVCVSQAGAQVPLRMNYQGVLTDSEGAAVPDGLYSATFRLYDAAESGTMFWEETQDILVQHSIFSVILGSVNPLDIPFDTPYWMGISVEGEPELAPRVELTSSAYAFTALSVPDTSVTGNKLAAGAVTGDKIADCHVVRALNGLADEVNLVAGSNVTITPSGNDLTIAASTGGGGVTGTGAAGRVAFWDGASSISGDDWLYWDQAAQRLGVGTPSPNAKLRVESNERFSGVFASTYQSDTTEVIRANYLGGGQVDAVAVRGISRPLDGYGIGGEFLGGFKGLVANYDSGSEPRADQAMKWGVAIDANAYGSTPYQIYRYGISASASGATGANNVAIRASATGDSRSNIGLYSSAEGSNNESLTGVYGYVNGDPTFQQTAVYGFSYVVNDSAYAGYFNGNLAYTGGFFSLSDRRFKTGLEPIGGALEKIQALKPKKYRYDEGFYRKAGLPKGEHYGLIAQEVEEVLPELVGNLLHPGRPAAGPDDPGEQPFDYKGINYIELIPVLVQAVKEQQRTIEDNRRTIEELKAEISSLRDR